MKDKNLKLPLHRAASVGHTGFISLLITPPPTAEVKVKAKLNQGDKQKNTPLHLAMESGNAEAAVLLIEAGAARDRVSSIRSEKLAHGTDPHSVAKH